MAINWKELELLLSELPLKDSYIQKVTEHSYKALTLSMFSKEEKAWLLYIELSTTGSRVCRTDHIREKTKQAQRFTQYLKAHIIGRRVTDIHQFAYDRAFSLTLSNSTDDITMIVRLFSGPGANIIITDKDNRIQELLYRRVARGEVGGEILEIHERESEGNKHFEVREHPENISFNEFIDRSESETSRENLRTDLIERLKEKRDKELLDLNDALRRVIERKRNVSGFESDKRYADLLSANLYRVKRGMDSITLDDWENGGKITISLDPALSANENLEKLYQRYRKDKKSSELAELEIEDKKREIEERERYWKNLIESEQSLSRLKKEANGENKNASALIKPGRPGLYIKSDGWDLIVGRNAKENDQILRTACRGSDIWMHTRDFAGGYIIIKSQRDKTVPLNVLLDAASLSIHFSKARKNKKADLYYTQVKYLRRIKGAKTGLIIPTQEKNLKGELDEERVMRLLGER